MEVEEYSEAFQVIEGAPPAKISKRLESDSVDELRSYEPEIREEWQAQSLEFDDVAQVEIESSNLALDDLEEIDAEFVEPALPAQIPVEHFTVVESLLVQSAEPLEVLREQVSSPISPNYYEELEKTVEERDKLIEVIADARLKVGIFAEQLHLAGENILARDTQISEMHILITSLENEVSKLRCATDAKLDNDAGMENRIKELEAENKALTELNDQNEYFQLAADLLEARSELEKKQSLVTEYSTKLKEKTAELQNFAEEKKALLRETDYRLSSVTNLNLQIEEKNCEIKLLESQLMGLNENVKLINKTYATTREEKDKLAEVLQTANEEIDDLREQVRRSIETNKNLQEKAEESQGQRETLSQSTARLEEENAELQQVQQSLEQQHYATNIENASKITGLLEDFEKYKATIMFLESDKEDMIAENERAMKMLQDEFDSSRQSEEELNAELKKQWEAAKEEARLKSEVILQLELELGYSREELNSNLAINSESIARLEQELETSNILNEEFENDLACKSERITTLEQELASSSVAKEELNTELVFKSELIIRLEKESTEARDMVLEKKKEIENLEISLADAESDIVILNEREKEAEEQAEALNEKIVALESVVERLEDLRKQQETNATHQSEHVTKLEEDLVTARESIIQLQQSLSSWEKEAIDSQETAQSIADKLALREQSGDEQAKYVLQLESTLANLNSQQEESKQASSRMQKQIETLRVENAIHAETLQEKLEEIGFLQQQRSQIDEDITELQRELQSTQETLELTKSTEEQSKTSVSETIATLRQVVAEKDEYITALEEKGHEMVAILSEKEEYAKVLENKERNMVLAFQKEIAEKEDYYAKSVEEKGLEAVSALKQELAEKEEYVVALEEKGQEVDKLIEAQETEHLNVQQFVLQLLKSHIEQESDHMLVEENGEKQSKFVAEVKSVLHTIHAWRQRSASESIAHDKTLAEQAENVRQLQSQREETNRLCNSQQDEISNLEKRLGNSETEVQTVRQLLTESQAIIKQSIEKPLDLHDARDDDLVALRARVDQLSQENVELSQKVSKYHTQRNVILKQMKALSDSAPLIAKENKVNGTENGKSRVPVTFK